MPERWARSLTGLISRSPGLARRRPMDGSTRERFATASGFKGVIANWLQGSLKITMYQPQCIARLTAGEAITLYPGCDKTATTCRVKFNNRINHQAEAHFLGINSIVGV